MPTRNVNLTDDLDRFVSGLACAVWSTGGTWCSTGGLTQALLLLASCISACCLKDRAWPTRMNEPGVSG